MVPLEVQDHKVPHLKALRWGKFESKEVSCGSTFIICPSALKSANLLHEQGFVDSQMVATVHPLAFIEQF